MISQEKSPIFAASQDFECLIQMRMDVTLETLFGLGPVLQSQLRRFFPSPLVC